jgi:hypothetical protein
LNAGATNVPMRCRVCESGLPLMALSADLKWVIIIESLHNRKNSSLFVIWRIHSCFTIWKRRERRWHLKHPANQRLNGGKGTLITLAQLLNCTWYLATTQCYWEKGIRYDWFLQTHENTSAVAIFRALNSLSVCIQEYHHAWPSYSL